MDAIEELCEEVAKQLLLLVLPHATIAKGDENVPATFPAYSIEATKSNLLSSGVAGANRLDEVKVTITRYCLIPKDNGATSADWAAIDQAINSPVIPVIPNPLPDWLTPFKYFATFLENSSERAYESGEEGRERRSNSRHFKFLVSV